jgi:hypothetical protein
MKLIKVMEKALLLFSANLPHPMGGGLATEKREFLSSLIKLNLAVQQCLSILHTLYAANLVENQP